MQNVDVNALLQGLQTLLAGGAQPGVNNGAQVANQTTEVFPPGVTGKIGGVYQAESVNDLYEWENHVQAKDGGTYRGLKVRFVSVEETKSTTKRKNYLARFEVCKVDGRNPMNEVVNIFCKDDQTLYRPYLNAAKWGHRKQEVVFKSEDPGEPERIMRMNMLTFDGELISDDAKRKCKYVLTQLGGLYDAYIDGVKLDIE